MAKTSRPSDEITLENSPISEGLRQVVEDCGISKYGLARAVGISKPQFYRFLRKDRGLSQENLDDLASHLKVRITLVRDESSGRPESHDSAPRAAIEPESETAPDQTFSLDRLDKILGDLKAAIDEEFAAFEARLTGRMPSYREDDAGRVGLPSDPSAAGRVPDGSSMKHIPQGGSVPTAPHGLLNVLRVSVKLRVHESITAMATGPWPSRAIGLKSVPPLVSPTPPGASGKSRFGIHHSAEAFEGHKRDDEGEGTVAGAKAPQVSLPAPQAALSCPIRARTSLRSDWPPWMSLVSPSPKTSTPPWAVREASTDRVLLRVVPQR